MLKLPMPNMIIEFIYVMKQFIDSMGSKWNYKNKRSNALYFDYVSTTNECIDLPYFATICQDMY